MTDPNEQDCPVCGTPMLWKYLNTRRCPKCNPLAKRYLLFPGYVTSRFDGDDHWITAHELARLYKVDIRECEVAPLDDGWRHTFGWTPAEDLIPLRPRYDGDYTLPETKFDSLRGLDYSDRALGIAASFKSMLTDCPEGWFTGQLAFHVNSAGAVDRIEELRITSETKTEFTVPAPDSQKPVEKQ